METEDCIDKDKTFEVNIKATLNSEAFPMNRRLKIDSKTTSETELCDPIDYLTTRLQEARSCLTDTLRGEEFDTEKSLIFMARNIFSLLFSVLSLEPNSDVTPAVTILYDILYLFEGEPS
jgi:hypothetical protein